MCGCWSAHGPTRLGGDTLQTQRPKSHDFGAELDWLEAADSTADLLAWAEESVEADPEVAERYARRVVSTSSDEAEVTRALWVVARAGVASADRDVYERAIVALLCPRRAGQPPLARPAPRIAAARPFSGCVPRTMDEALLVSVWATAAQIYAGGPSASPAVVEHALHQALRAATDGQQRAAAWMQLWRHHRAWDEPERAFGALASLAAEVPDDPTGDWAALELARMIVDDDWNRDGRKDARSGLGRPVVRTWLATHPDAAGPVLLRVVERLSLRHRCAEARRAHSALRARAPDYAQLQNVRTAMARCGVIIQ